MPNVLRRVFVPSADPDGASNEIRHVFHRHVQSAITPPLSLQTVPGGVVVDLDVRVYDNYRVDDALVDLGRSHPGMRELQAADQGSEA